MPEPASEPAPPARPRPRPRPGPGASAPIRDTDPRPRKTFLERTNDDDEADEPTRLKPGKPPSAAARKRARSAIRAGVLLLIVAVAAITLRTYVVAPYYIPSASMEPTLHGCSGCNDDQVLVDKLSYRMHGVHRGDVVVFNRPSSWQVDEKVLIKRVVGLPGDRLTVRGGHIYVNGLLLEEPYVNRSCAAMTALSEAPHPPSTRVGPIPNGDLFVMGDNRCDSTDSRAFGAIPQKAIIGRAFLIIWPLGRIHYL